MSLSRLLLTRPELGRWTLWPWWASQGAFAESVRSISQNDLNLDTMSKQKLSGERISSPVVSNIKLSTAEIEFIAFEIFRFPSWFFGFNSDSDASRIGDMGSVRQDKPLLYWCTKPGDSTLSEALELLAWRDCETLENLEASFIFCKGLFWLEDLLNNFSLPTELKDPILGWKDGEGLEMDWVSRWISSSLNGKSSNSSEPSKPIVRGHTEANWWKWSRGLELLCPSSTKL